VFRLISALYTALRTSPSTRTK